MYIDQIWVLFERVERWEGTIRLECLHTALLRDWRMHFLLFSISGSLPQPPLGRSSYPEIPSLGSGTRVLPDPEQLRLRHTITYLPILQPRTQLWDLFDVCGLYIVQWCQLSLFNSVKFIFYPLCTTSENSLFVCILSVMSNKYCQAKPLTS